MTLIPEDWKFLEAMHGKVDKLATAALALPEGERDTFVAAEVFDVLERFGTIDERFALAMARYLSHEIRRRLTH